jgi:hypothetical protein
MGAMVKEKMPHNQVFARNAMLVETLSHPIPYFVSTLDLPICKFTG